MTSKVAWTSSSKLLVFGIGINAAFVFNLSIFKQQNVLCVLAVVEEREEEEEKEEEEKEEEEEENAERRG